jgi:hypothetical protein
MTTIARLLLAATLALAVLPAHLTGGAPDQDLSEGDPWPVPPRIAKTDSDPWPVPPSCPCWRGECARMCVPDAAPGAPR